MKEVKAEKERDKRVRCRDEEQPEEMRAQSTMSGFGELATGQGRTGHIQGRAERKKSELISVEICGKDKRKGDR